MQTKAPNRCLAHVSSMTFQKEEVEAVCENIVNKAIKWNESIHHVAAVAWLHSHLHLHIQFVCHFIVLRFLQEWLVCMSFNESGYPFTDAH